MIELNSEEKTVITIAMAIASKIAISRELEFPELLENINEDIDKFNVAFDLIDNEKLLEKVSIQL